MSAVTTLVTRQSGAPAVVAARSAITRFVAAAIFVLVYGLLVVQLLTAAVGSAVIDGQPRPAFTGATPRPAAEQSVGAAAVHPDTAPASRPAPGPAPRPAP